VFTTRFCAACGPVAEQLRACDDGARVVTVDVEQAPELAGAYRVRSAPTVVLAGSGGEVRARLVGPASVRDYLRELVAD
jgi:thioredoxin-like negative regulator of GroEL